METIVWVLNLTFEDASDHSKLQSLSPYPYREPDRSLGRNGLR